MEGSGGFFLPNTGMGSLQEILPETDRPAEDFPMNRSTQVSITVLHVHDFISGLLKQ